MVRDLDVDALEAGLAAWVRSSAAGAAAAPGELGHVALDGKRLRGSRTAEGAGVHLLAAFCRSLQGVIGELRVPPGSNEISAALTLLQGLSLDGVLVTGDAEFAQREICRTIVDGGGDHFFVVKDNQPRLRADIALLFAAPPPEESVVPPGTAPAADRVARWAKGHGRVEWRQLEASAALAGCLDWPGAAQVCRVERRRRRIRGKDSAEVVHAITGLGPDRATAADLLALSRAHRAIENRLHWVRDVTLRADACRVRSGQAPQVLAACRNAVLTLLRRLGGPIVEGIERFQEHRRAALNLVRYGRSQ